MNGNAWGIKINFRTDVDYRIGLPILAFFADIQSEPRKKMDSEGM